MQIIKLTLQVCYKIVTHTWEVAGIICQLTADPSSSMAAVIFCLIWVETRNLFLGSEYIESSLFTITVKVGLLLSVSP